MVTRSINHLSICVPLKERPTLGCILYGVWGYFWLLGFLPSSTLSILILPSDRHPGTLHPGWLLLARRRHHRGHRGAGGDRGHVDGTRQTGPALGVAHIYLRQDGGESNCQTESGRAPNGPLFQLLDGDQELLSAMYGLLMLLPQSDAFHLVKGRLACVPQIHKQDKARQARRLKRKKYLDEIDFPSLLEHFQVNHLSSD